MTVEDIMHYDTNIEKLNEFKCIPLLGGSLVWKRG